MASFFISHSSLDREAAERVRDRLRLVGYESLFLDFDPSLGIPVGRDWERELYMQLRLADAVIFLGSPPSIESKWCFAELALARATGKPIFPIVIAPGPPHPLLTDTQSINLAREGEAGFDRLWNALRRQGFDPSDSFAWDQTRPPYPGLAPLQPEDAAVFFGRDDKIEQLLSRLQPTLQSASRFVTLIGPSGSGKSSLVRAGVIPRLKRLRDRWVVLRPLRPGTRPLSSLARSLAHELGEVEWKGIRQRLKHDPSCLAELIDELFVGTSQGATSALLVIDQAEELVIAQEEERDGFLAALRPAIQSASPLRVLATLRAEHVGTVLEQTAIADLIGSAVVLGPLELSRLAEVIEGPARRAGLELDPGLAVRMVEETSGGDALPLLAYTLRELYDLAGPAGRITTKEYESIGGVVGALRARADSIAKELEQSGRGDLVIPTLLKFAAVLQDGKPIRRRVKRNSLSAGEDEVVQAFVEARLITSNGTEHAATAEVAHEALLRAWAPLDQAIRSSQDMLRMRTNLEHLAQEWDSVGRPTSYLLREERLTSALSFLEQENADVQVSSLVREFVMLSTERSQAFLRRETDLLAGRVHQTLDQDPELGILLALAALEEYTQTPRVIGALDAAVAASKVRLHLRGHEGYVGSAAFSPLGDRVVTASADTTARIWDATNGEQLRVLGGHEDIVNEAVFSPSENRVLTASDDGTARIWDPTNGEQLAVLRHDDWVLQAVYSPDGRMIASASRDEPPRIWDAASGRQLAVLRHTNWDGGAVFSPSGERILTSSSDRRARIWDVFSGQPLLVIGSDDCPVVAAAYSPDGSRIVARSNDQVARVWDASSGEQLLVLRGHDERVGVAAFSPDGSRIVTAAYDRTARVWDATNGEQLAILLGHEDGVRMAAFSPDGGRIVTASSDRTARIWDVTSEQAVLSGKGEQLFALRGHGDVVNGAVFSPDGNRILTASSDRTARIWDVTSDELLVLRGHENQVDSAAFSRDGSRIVTASYDRTARIWDATNGEQLSILLGHEDGVRMAAFSPDGSRIATASNDRTARIWDAANGNQLIVMRGHERGLGSTAYSPDGSRVVTASDDKTARIWKTTNGNQLAVVHGHEWVADAHFSPDARRLVIGLGDGTSLIWDVTSGEKLMVLRGHTGPVLSVVFSPDGDRVATASADGTARIWDAISGEQLAVLRSGREGWGEWVRSVAFSPDGSRVATASDDRTARVWEVTSGEQVAVLRGHTRGVECVDYSPDGTRIVTASVDGTAKVWETLSVPQLIARARTGVSRVLTNLERANYGFGRIP